MTTSTECKKNMHKHTLTMQT